MNIFEHMHKLSTEDIEDTPIKTFTDEDNHSAVTNEDIDENNDSITEKENEVQEQQAERDDEVEENEKSDDEEDVSFGEDETESGDADFESDLSNMQYAGSYTESELRAMSPGQLSQILFLAPRVTMDASDLVILDNEVVNAGDDKQGAAIGGDDSGGGGGGGDDFGGDDDGFGDMDFHYQPEIHTEVINDIMGFGQALKNMELWSAANYVKNLTNFILNITIITVVYVYKIHLAFFKFASLHVPRLITSIRATSKLWNVKLSLILPRVKKEALDDVEVTAVDKELWDKSYRVLIDTYKWVQTNARPMIKESDESKVSDAIDKVVERLSTIGVDWDGYSRNMVMSEIRGQRKRDSINALGYTKDTIPGLIDNLFNIGRMYDRAGVREITNTLRIVTDTTAEMFKEAEELEGDARSKAISKAERYKERVNQIHAMHRACIEVARLLTSDFEAVLRGYEVASYRQVKKDHE